MMPDTSSGITCIPRVARLSDADLRTSTSGSEERDVRWGRRTDFSTAYPPGWNGRRWGGLR